MSTPTAAGRRLRFGVLTLVLVLAATASAVIAILIGDRTSLRIDATDTGEHRLSPRTRQLIDSLAHDYEIVLAVNRAEVDPRALQRVRDVADLLGHASPRLTFTLIDTAAPRGLDQFDRLLVRLAERDQADIDQQVSAVEAAISTLNDQSAWFADSLSPALASLAELAAPAPDHGARVRDVLSTQSSTVAAGARLLAEAAQQASAALKKASVGAARLPATDQAAPILAGHLRQLTSDLAVLESQLVGPIAAADSMPEDARAAARPLAAELLRRKVRVAVQADLMARLKPLNLQRIARALEATSAVLVIGPREAGLNAIDPGALFPAAEQIDRAAGVQADLRRRAEDLFTTSIGLLEDPNKPIVMFVHGETQRILENTAFLGPIAYRLTVQGIDLAEWPVALEPRPPGLASIDPAGSRPVVFVVLATDASKTVATDPKLAGPSRATALGQALDALIEQGDPVMLCLQPSTLPSYGQADPMVASLHLLGLQADTARPIMTEAPTPAGRTVSPDHLLRADDADHAIARAVRGLPTIFPWPVGVREAAAAPGVTLSTLYSVPASDAWAESQWLGFWQVPPEQRASVIDPPTPDSARDDPRGPWPVAIAATRTSADFPAPQRILIVGANRWMFYPFTTEIRRIDGRMAPRFPGNVEFFEAAVQWLAGKDSLIAQTATARAVPLIRPLTPAQLSLWRWSVIGGLPLLALACGLAWRILRG